MYQGEAHSLAPCLDGLGLPNSGTSVGVGAGRAQLGILWVFQEAPGESRTLVFQLGDVA